MLSIIAQSLALSYAAGISPYATITLVGLMERAHWIGPLPGALGPLSNPVILAIAGTLAVVEFVGTLVPGIAAAWDSIHTAIRPPAAALLAVLTAWHADGSIIALVALLGGGLGLATHATKLGVRFAVDASPEPVTNGVMNVAEWSILGAVSYFTWSHPVAALVAALALLIVTMLVVRIVWRVVRRALMSLTPSRQTPARSA